MADVNPHLDTIAPWISAGIRRTVATAELATVFPDTYQQVAAAAGRAGAQLVGPAVTVAASGRVDRGFAVPGPRC